MVFEAVLSTIFDDICVEIEIRDRISFEEHAQTEGQFKNYYRMSYDMFWSLRDLLRP